jgi:hypothetical protein
MTIQIELSPQAEAKLVVGALAHGLEPETYAGKLLQEVLASAIESPDKLTVEQFHSMLDELAKDSDDLPDLPTESFTRSSFYEDRA